MVYRSFPLLYSTPVMQVFMGLSVGIAFSIILAPFWEQHSCNSLHAIIDDVSENFAQKQKDVLLESKGNDGDKLTIKTAFSKDFESPEYEPKHVKIEHHEAPLRAATVDSSRRARYISTELGTREKLFIGVLTNRDTVDTFGVAVNRTLSQYATKLVFFMNLRKQTLPNGMSLVIFNDEKVQSVSIQMLKYVGSHYLAAYDWFFFIRDDTYVKGKQLFDLISRTSINRDVIMGLPKKDQRDRSQTYCELGPGILLSQVWY